MDLDYIRKLNGTYGKTCRQSIIDDMLCQYEEANKNVVTEFDVLINSSKAKNVFIDNTPSKVLMTYKNNKNTSDSDFMWEVKNYPNEVKLGSYLMHVNEVTGEDDYYLCTSKPMNKRGYDINYFKYCNQKIQLNKDTFIPCIASNDGFGVRLVASNDIITESDTKIKIIVQRNPITEAIPLNTRFILGFSKNGIYKILDVTVYKDNLLIYTCRKDDFIKEYDDIENGIAYNEDVSIADKPIEYMITGSDFIRKSQSETYIINNPSEGGLFEVDDFSNSVDIVSQDESSITIKCLSYGDYFTLNYIVNGIVMAQKDVSLVR